MSIVELFMKWFGLEQKQAEYALLGFVIVIIGISVFLFLYGGNNPKYLTPEQMKQMQNYRQ